MFLKNKYLTWYFNIINNAKKRIKDPNNYYERHHIIPSSFDIDNFNFNYKNNLVFLTAKEHYICHLLLTKISIGINKYRMIYAFDYMQSSPNNNNRRISHTNGTMFEINKIKANELRKNNKQFGKDNGSYGTVWVYHLNKEKNIKIPKIFLNDYLSIGYTKGRCFDFKKRKEIERKKLIKKEEKLNNKLERYYVFKQKFKYYQSNGWKNTKQKYNLNYSEYNLKKKFASFKLT